MRGCRLMDLSAPSARTSLYLFYPNLILTPGRLVEAHLPLTLTLTLTLTLILTLTLTITLTLTLSLTWPLLQVSDELVLTWGELTASVPAMAGAADSPLLEAPPRVSGRRALVAGAQG